MTASETPLPLPSPCVNICKIHAQTGLCEGCWRNLDEIAIWGGASEPEKQAIWQKIRQRKQHDQLNTE